MKRGMSPIPLPLKSKAPDYEDWQNLCLTPNDLDAQFPTGQERNIGVLNGRPSNNLLDVDLDCAEAVAVAPVLLPATGCLFGRPGKPRSHWIFRADRPFDTAQDAYKDLDGTMLLELRGTGGLTVFPPSLHKETGELIEWERFDDPTNIALADLQRAVGEVAAAALLARHWPSKGARDDTAMALTGGLLRGGWTVEKVETFVFAVAQAAGDEEARSRARKAGATARKQEDGKNTTGWPMLAKYIGLAGKDVVHQVREWLGMADKTTAAKKKKVRTVEPFCPFPVDALPEPIAEFVRQGALALGCDPSYIALPALAAAASVIGNTRTIRLKRGWTEPCIVWSAIVGDSGTLKSPAYLLAVSHLFRAQKRLLDDFKEKLVAYEEALAKYKVAKKEAGDNGTDPGDPPEKPVQVKIICSDTTIEKLAEILEDNPRGTLVARDELAGWLASFTRYKSGGGGSDLPNWLEMFRAGTVIVDRKTGTRPSLFIPRAAVCVTGSIQPGVLTRALTPEFLDAGLAARLLMAMPPKSPKCWSEVEIAPEVEAAYHSILDKLLALDFGHDGDGEKAP